MKQSLKKPKMLTQDEIGEKQSVKVPDKLPKAFKDNIDNDDLSLAIDMALSNFAVIEVTGCVDEQTMKVEPAVQRLIERAGTYVEFVPRSDGIRIIGLTYCGKSTDLHCRGQSFDSANFTISIHRNCDRWVDISGIPLLDKPFRKIDELIDELIAEIAECIFLR